MEVQPGWFMARCLPREKFWLSYLRLGFVVLSVESTAAILYFLVAPGIIDRAVPILVAALAVLASAVAFPLLGFISTRPWRASFSLGAALAAGGLLTLCCAFNGGDGSPLIYLAALPILNSALALPMRGVWICTGAGLAEVTWLFVSDSSFNATDLSFVSVVALLGGTILLSLLAASSRMAMEAQETADRSRLLEMASTDRLTGCLNNKSFYVRIEEEVQRCLRTCEVFSLLMIDIDFFKSYNDRFGHQAGDRVLSELGAVLRGAARIYDVVGRVGGDEFAVLMAATGAPAARAVAQRIVATVIPAQLDVNVSIGVATFDRHEPTVRRVVRDADSALYLAKVSGRAQVAGPGIHVGDKGSKVSSAVLLAADTRVLAERVRQVEREKEESSALLAATLSEAPVGVCYLDSEFRIRKINSVLAKVNGAAIEEHLGRRVAEMVPDLWHQLQPLYRRVLATGSSVTVENLSGRTASDPERVHYWLTNIFPVALGMNERGLGVIALDVTDRKELEERTANVSASIVAALAATVEMRDPYTAGHQERVAQIAASIGLDLGLDPQLVADVGLAARIHDLGKVRVPAEILSRPGRLLDMELELVRAHSQAGYEILASVGFPEHISLMVLQHHERLDGSGYPRGLKGDELSPGAKILAVADVAEAMSAPRPYRVALGVDAARAELVHGRGTLYDEGAVDSYLRLNLPSAPSEVDVARTGRRPRKAGDEAAWDHGRRIA